MHTFKLCEQTNYVSKQIVGEHSVKITLKFSSNENRNWMIFLIAAKSIAFEEPKMKWKAIKFVYGRGELAYIIWKFVRKQTYLHSVYVMRSDDWGRSQRLEEEEMIFMPKFACDKFRLFGMAARRTTQFNVSNSSNKRELYVNSSASLSLSSSLYICNLYMLGCKFLPKITDMCLLCKWIFSHTSSFSHRTQSHFMSLRWLCSLLVGYCCCCYFFLFLLSILSRWISSFLLMLCAVLDLNAMGIYIYNIILIIIILLYIHVYI